MADLKRTSTSVFRRCQSSVSDCWRRIKKAPAGVERAEVDLEFKPIVVRHLSCAIRGIGFLFNHLNAYLVGAVSKRSSTNR